MIAFLAGWFTFLILEILLELKKISTLIEINNRKNNP